MLLGMIQGTGAGELSLELQVHGQENLQMLEERLSMTLQTVHKTGPQPKELLGQVPQILHLLEQPLIVRQVTAAGQRLQQPVQLQQAE